MDSCCEEGGGGARRKWRRRVSARVSWRGRNARRCGTGRGTARGNSAGTACAPRLRPRPPSSHTRVKSDLAHTLAARDRPRRSGVPRRSGRKARTRHTASWGSLASIADSSLRREGRGRDCTPTIAEAEGAGLLSHPGARGCRVEGQEGRLVERVGAAGAARGRGRETSPRHFRTRAPLPTRARTRAHRAPGACRRA